MAPLFPFLRGVGTNLAIGNHHANSKVSPARIYPSIL